MVGFSNNFHGVEKTYVDKVIFNLTFCIYYSLLSFWNCSNCLFFIALWNLSKLPVSILNISLMLCEIFCRQRELKRQEELQRQQQEMLRQQEQRKREMEELEKQKQQELQRRQEQQRQQQQEALKKLQQEQLANIQVRSTTTNNKFWPWPWLQTEIIFKFKIRSEILCWILLCSLFW